MIKSSVVISELSVGKHWYWKVFNYQFHGQVLVTTWFVFAVIGMLSIIANRNLNETNAKLSEHKMQLDKIAS